MVGDNLASLYSMQSLSPFCHRWEPVRLLRSLFNLLWESGPVTMFVVWCPGALVPADPLSRLSPLHPGTWARAMGAAQERADFLYSRMSVLGLVGSVLI